MKGSSARWGALAAVLAGCAGCSVPLGAAEGLSPVNTCGSAGDCPQGSTCAAGACVATDYDLTGLVLEVRPLPGAPYGAGRSFLVDPAAAGVSLASHGSGSPLVASFQAPLPALVSIQKGQVLPDPSTGCVVPGGGIPANLTFYRASPYTGLSFDAVTASATSAGGSDPFTYSVELVPDTYDVYIEPQIVKTCNGGEAYPPVFLPKQTINANGAVSWKLPPVGTLSGSITGLASMQWKVDLVEPTRGLPVSSNGKLTVQSGGAAVSAQISWTDATVAPILRLTPSAPGTAASVYWTLEGAVFTGTATSPTVSFTVGGLQMGGTMVTGQILGLDGLTGVPSQLTFQSTMLLGGDGGSAAFSLNTTTDMVGDFSVSLPPGDYALRAVPQATLPQAAAVRAAALSITDFPLPWPASWTPSDSCVCGQSFTLNARTSLTGSITTAAGEPLAGTTVGVVPAPIPQRSFLAQTHTLDPVATRVVSGTTDSAGGFALAVDRGTSNLLIQPDPGTRLPWLVRPELPLNADQNLGPLVLTSPVFLGGTVLDPHGMPVSDAEINAWLPIHDASSPQTAVQIATGSTDANGVFSLVLPSSL